MFWVHDQMGYKLDYENWQYLGFKVEESCFILEVIGGTGCVNPGPQKPSLRVSVARQEVF